MLEIEAKDASGQPQSQGQGNYSYRESVNVIGVRKSTVNPPPTFNLQNTVRAPYVGDRLLLTLNVKQV